MLSSFEKILKLRRILAKKRSKLHSQNEITVRGLNYNDVTRLLVGVTNLDNVLLLVFLFDPFLLLLLDDPLMDVPVVLVVRRAGREGVRPAFLLHAEETKVKF